MADADAVAHADADADALAHAVAHAVADADPDPPILECGSWIRTAKSEREATPPQACARTTTADALP